VNKPRMNPPLPAPGGLIMRPPRPRGGPMGGMGGPQKSSKLRIHHHMI